MDTILFARYSGSSSDDNKCDTVLFYQGNEYDDAPFIQNCERVHVLKRTGENRPENVKEEFRELWNKLPICINSFEEIEQYSSREPSESTISYIYQIVRNIPTKLVSGWRDFSEGARSMIESWVSNLYLLRECVQNRKDAFRLRILKLEWQKHQPLKNTYSRDGFINSISGILE